MADQKPMISAVVGQALMASEKNYFRNVKVAVGLVVDHSPEHATEVRKHFRAVRAAMTNLHNALEQCADDNGGVAALTGGEDK